MCNRRRQLLRRGRHPVHPRASGERRNKYMPSDSAAAQKERLTGRAYLHGPTMHACCNSCCPHDESVTFHFNHAPGTSQTCPILSDLPMAGPGVAVTPLPPPSHGMQTLASATWVRSARCRQTCCKRLSATWQATRRASRCCVRHAVQCVTFSTRSTPAWCWVGCRRQTARMSACALLR